MDLRRACDDSQLLATGSFDRSQQPGPGSLTSTLRRQRRHSINAATLQKVAGTTYIPVLIYITPPGQAQRYADETQVSTLPLLRTQMLLERPASPITRRLDSEGARRARAMPCAHAFHMIFVRHAVKLTAPRPTAHPPLGRDPLWLDDSTIIGHVVQTSWRPRAPTLDFSRSPSIDPPIAAHQSAQQACARGSAPPGRPIRLGPDFEAHP